MMNIATANPAPKMNFLFKTTIVLKVADVGNENSGN